MGEHSKGTSHPESTRLVIEGLRALADAIEQGQVNVISWSSDRSTLDPSRFDIEFQNAQRPLPDLEEPPQSAADRFSSGYELRQTQHAIKRIMENTYGL